MPPSSLRRVPAHASQREARPAVSIKGESLSYRRMRPSTTSICSRSGRPSTCRRSRTSGMPQRPSTGTSRPKGRNDAEGIEPHSQRHHHRLIADGRQISKPDVRCDRSRRPAHVTALGRSRISIPRSRAATGDAGQRRRHARCRRDDRGIFRRRHAGQRFRHGEADARAVDRSAGSPFSQRRCDADYEKLDRRDPQLEIVGRDVNVTAHGTMALNDTGQSNLTFHADSPRLAGDRQSSSTCRSPESAARRNRDRQSHGAAGERARSAGDGIKYQENGALTRRLDLHRRRCRISFERAAVDADSKATFVTVAGQKINELTAKTTYADKPVNFDATAKQPNRSLDRRCRWCSIRIIRKCTSSVWRSHAGQQQWTHSARRASHDQLRRTTRSRSRSFSW